MKKAILNWISEIMFSRSLTQRSVIWKLESSEKAKRIDLNDPQIITLPDLVEFTNQTILQKSAKYISASRTINCFESITILGNFLGLPCTRSGSVVWEAIDPFYFPGSFRRNLIRVQIQKRRSAKLSLDAAFIIQSSWSSNYFHWIFDILCRLYFIDDPQFQETKLVTAVNLSSFQKETLAALNLEEKVYFTGSENIKVKTLVSPSFMMKDRIFNPVEIDWLRKKLLPEQPGLSS